MQTPAELAATKLEREMNSWKSIELKCRSDNVNYDLAQNQGKPLHFHQDCRYIETTSGQRLYEDRMERDSDPTVSITTKYSDGTNFKTHFRYEREGVATADQLTILSSFGLERLGGSDRPPPLQFHYLGLKPLPEVLSQAEYLGEGRWIDRPCDQFLFTHSLGNDDFVQRIYWLDRETGIPLRMEYYDNEETRTQKRPDHLWNAKSLDTIDGRHLVLNSELTQFNDEKSLRDQVEAHYEFTTSEVAFDRGYALSRFQPTITKHTTIANSVNGKITSPKEPLPFSRPSSTMTPIQAVEPTEWDLPSSSASWLLGIALLATAFILWWRRGA